MRVLVTGAAGFTGSWMMQFLLQQKGVQVTGLVRKDPELTADFLTTSYVIADLLDRDILFTTIARVNPDAIIHLAGLTRGPLDALLSTNVTGTKNLLDACSQANPDCRILVVSSSAVYGNPGPAPIIESLPLHPLSEYGVSKMAQDAFSLMHHELNDTQICIARPFNLTGPGQPDSFVCGRIVGQVAGIMLQNRQALDLLETSSKRDFIDVRDVVRGYWALISHPEFSCECAGQVFNLGSGTAHSVSEIIALLEELSVHRFKVILPETPHESSIISQQSDNSRINTLTDWRAEISLKESLRNMLAEHCEKKIV
jgi:nucleoside-diphosphate-sugar epimerase